MTWKGAMRSIGTAVRAAERDARRRQRELEIQQKHYEKMRQLEQAAYEVDSFVNYIDVIQSLHKESSKKIDWVAIANIPQPVKPEPSHAKQKKAIIKEKSYNPGFFDKYFKRTEKKQLKLSQAVDRAKESDFEEYRKNIEKWKSELNEWKEKTNISKLLMEGNKEAKLDIIKELNPFSEISDLGSGLSFLVHDNSIIEAEVYVHGEDIVPSEVKSLLQSGKLSVKKMPKGRFYEIYQDYVCSSVIRVANELFSILPEHLVIVTAMDDILNSKSGHIEKQPILSVAVSRKTIDCLNLNAIDPSDSMSNFIHNMSFKKTSGFSPISRITPDGLENQPR